MRKGKGKGKGKGKDWGKHMWHAKGCPSGKAEEIAPAAHDEARTQDTGVSWKRFHILILDTLKATESVCH